jgi:hypothetical protein
MAILAAHPGGASEPPVYRWDVEVVILAPASVVSAPPDAADIEVRRASTYSLRG